MTRETKIVISGGAAHLSEGAPLAAPANAGADYQIVSGSLYWSQILERSRSRGNVYVPKRTSR